MHQHNLTERSNKSGIKNAIVPNIRRVEGQVSSLVTSSRIRKIVAMKMIALCFLGLSMFYIVSTNNLSANDATSSILHVPDVREIASENNMDMEPKKKKEPLEGWIYEPKNANLFWKKMGDRPFQREFYSRLGKFNRIVDVGARGYNRYCKDLINSTTAEYFQIEPFPPSPAAEMNNDGLLECYMQEVGEKYPNLKNSFDLVIDFGVLGWKPVLDGLDESGIRKYVESVRFLLKDRGCWALKIDKGWVLNQQEFFDTYLLPYFNLGDFDNAYKSGHSIKRGKFIFYFFYKK